MIGRRMIMWDQTPTTFRHADFYYRPSIGPQASALSWVEEMLLKDIPKSYILSPAPANLLTPTLCLVIQPQ